VSDNKGFAELISISRDKESFSASEKMSRSRKEESSSSEEDDNEDGDW
jgi:hypothetical protein